MGLNDSLKDKVYVKVRVLVNTAITTGKRNPEEAQEGKKDFVDTEGVENFRRKKLINSIRCISNVKQDMN